jgi:tetratricopeptide (TPR) repeat protein
MKAIALATIFAAFLSAICLPQEVKVQTEPNASSQSASADKLSPFLEVEKYYRLGEEQLRGKKWGEAMASFTRALSIDPKHAKAIQGLERASAGFRKEGMLTLLKIIGALVLIMAIMYLGLSYKSLRSRIKLRKRKTEGLRSRKDT